MTGCFTLIMTMKQIHWLKAQILSYLQNVIDSLNKYKGEADSTIQQLKTQAKNNVFTL
jgi:prefoldin subunit 5